MVRRIFYARDFIDSSELTIAARPICTERQELSSMLSKCCCQLHGGTMEKLLN